MKKPVIFLLIIVLLFILLFFLPNNEIFSNNGENQIIEEDPIYAFDYKQISVNYDANNKETGFAYNDGMFLRDSEELSTDMVKLSINLAVTAYDSNQISDVLAQMGFLEQRFYNYTDYKTTPEEVESVTLFNDNRQTTMADNDFVGYSISNKTIKYNNTDYMVYIVAVRGTPSTAEWFSDFRLSENNDINKENGYHYGFYTAAEEVKKSLKGVLKNDSFDNPENTIILVTGHSRGAAVANIVAGELSTKVEYNDYVKRNHVFGYNFACPYVSTSADTTLTNIYNFNNPGDLIPELPRSKWGYKRYGIDKKFEGTDWENVNQRFKTICNSDPKLLHTTEDVMNLLTALVDEKEDFYKPGNQIIFKTIAYYQAGRARF